MKKNNFKLEFTKKFWETFDNVLDHIENKIKNPNARNALFIEVMDAIDKRLPFADSFTSIEVKSESKVYKVYHIKVSNFYVIYEIKEKGNYKIMVVERFAYGGMNLKGYLY